MRALDSIAPIILAAGDSTRMGYPKALLPLGGDIFLTRILKTLRSVGFPPATIVLGNAAPKIRPCIIDWQAEVCINPDPGRGQLSSIRIALEHIAPESGAAMLWPVDQPAMSEILVRDLVQLFIRSEALVALPIVGTRRGHPAIVDRILFKEFMETPLDEGAKPVFLRHQKATAILPTNEQAAVEDIDTPEDYKTLTRETLKSALARLTSS
jgi:molybdenum cofactor cytidylyltransferase